MLVQSEVGFKYCCVQIVAGLKPDIAQLHAIFVVFSRQLDGSCVFLVQVAFSISVD